MQNKTDIVNEFLTQTYKEQSLSGGYSYVEVRPRIICMDGVSLSVQAADGMYCQPRINHSSYYSEVEVGYPSIRPPESWREYFEGGWQRKGLIGSLGRIWKDRGHIWYSIKRKKGISKWSLKYYTSFRDNATMSVYAYIPTSLVNEFIEDHGGIDWDKSIA